MQRLLIIGAGDVAQRLAPQILQRYQRVYVLVRRAESAAAWRAKGVIPIIGDLDNYRSLRRLAGLAQQVTHLAPPPDSGIRDTRTRHLALALSYRGSLPYRFSYISTSGVYGDCHGEWVKESHPSLPATARGKRRLHAESILRNWARRRQIRLGILRAPGIYAVDRLPLQRLQNQTPALLAEEDSYSNHIHADDLAQLALLALWRASPCRIYHASDDQPLKMGDYFDLVADYAGVPHPPRMSRAELASQVSALQMSFLNESRRLDNTRLRRELRARLQYPTVDKLLRVKGEG